MIKSFTDTLAAIGYGKFKKMSEVIDLNIYNTRLLHGARKDLNSVLAYLKKVIYMDHI